MRTRIIFATLVLAAVTAGTAYALSAGGNDAPAGQDNARCLPEAVDCNDTPGFAEGEPAPGGGMAMCAPGVTDCVDVVIEDEFDVEAARQAAFDLIGAAEADLPADVRISRRGTEEFALTEDYVLGRMTVQLDDDGTGTYRVTVLIVELPDGPETIMS